MRRWGRALQHIPAVVPFFCCRSTDAPDASLPLARWRSWCSSNWAYLVLHVPWPDAAWLRMCAYFCVIVGDEWPSRC